MEIKVVKCACGCDAELHIDDSGIDFYQGDEYVTGMTVDVEAAAKIIKYLSSLITHQTKGKA